MGETNEQMAGSPIGLEADAPPPPTRPGASQAIPVTSFRTGRTAGLWIALSLCGTLALAAMAALAFYLVTFGPQPSAATRAALLERVHSEYPAFDPHIGASVRRTQGGRVSAITYFTLESAEVDGFTLLLSYVAPQAKKDDVSAYDNDDLFFQQRFAAYNPQGSFMKEWVRDLPGVMCLGVLETIGSTSETKTYEVYYYADRGGDTSTEVVQRTMAYATSSGRWQVLDGDAGADPPGAGTGSEVLSGDVSDQSTEAVVADYLPEFEVAGAAQEANGTWVSVLRHRDHRRVFVSVDTDYMGVTDSTVQLFTDGKTRARSFLKMWDRRHPGVLITFIEIDPDYSGDENLMSVSYSLSRRWSVIDKTEVLRYSPKKNAWTVVERY